MGKLSKAKALTETEKFCIEGMINNEMSVSEIARTLGREKSLIENLLEAKKRKAKPTKTSETAIHKINE